VNCKIACADAGHVTQVWPIAAELIKSATDHDDLADFSVLECDVLEGRALLWLVADDDLKVQAAVVTQVAGINGARYCTIVACGGQHSEEWLPLIDAIETYAKLEACAAMRIYGCRGWLRLLPDYKQIGFILERAL